MRLWSCEIVKLMICKVVKLKYFALWRDSSLRCASFRMTGLCFYSWLEICFNGRIIFEMQRFFFLNCFFKWAKLAIFIRYEAMWWRMKDEGCGVKSMSREGVSCELWVMSYELWVVSYECGVKLWSWNILLYEEILHCAVLRSEWQGYVFCSRLGI